MLFSTKLVPVGITSFTVTLFAKSPVFVTVIVYVIVSPSNTYPTSGCSIVAVLFASIIASTYLCSTSFVGSSSIVATFLICVLLPKSFTVTVNSTVLSSFASNSSFIPVVVKSSNWYVSLEPSTFMLPSVNVVPSGISSLTVTVSGAVPSFVNVITYVIGSFCFTVLPLAGVDVFAPVTCGFFTSSVTLFVSFPSTFALFVIVPSYVSSANSFTVTSNVTTTFPCAGTSTFIPFCKSVCVYVWS